VAPASGKRLDYFPKSGRATWVSSNKWFTIPDIEQFITADMGNDIANIEHKLKDSIDQQWKVSYDRTIHRDQYGNEIHKIATGYILYRKQSKIIEVNRLHTAKLISNIIVNDIIHFKKLSDANQK
jgi:hypothetical protein